MAAHWASASVQKIERERRPFVSAQSTATPYSGMSVCIPSDNLNRWRFRRHLANELFMCFCLEKRTPSLRAGAAPFTIQKVIWLALPSIPAILASAQNLSVGVLVHSQHFYVGKNAS